MVVHAPYPGQNTTTNHYSASPTKKHSNTASKADNNAVERINVTIPNPLLMLNGNIQIQYLQEIVRNVIQRVDDIFHCRQLIDIKNNKLKDKALAGNGNESTIVFDEIKSKEVQRINKENSLLMRYKDARIEDKLLRKQVVKGCKKISLAFKGAIEEDEELEKELLNQKEIVLSEICVLEIMGDKLTTKQKCAITLKAKLIESCLKEKEYDPYFSISLVLQGARNTFIREIGRHVDVYCENIESSNSSNQVRRLYKNMVDTHHLRRVKLFRDTKTDKFFKLLLSHNEESKKYVLAYKKSFEEAQRRKQE